MNIDFLRFVERNVSVMIKSMTAFGRAKETIDNKVITVELKSVNSRYFDCSIRIPRLYSFLEDKIKSYLTASGIARGKLDVGVMVEQTASSGVTVDLDAAYTESYVAALRRLRDEFGLTDDISVMTVAQNRDVFAVQKHEEDAEKDWADIKAVLDIALKEYNAMKEAEGERLLKDIKGKIEGIKEITAEIEAASDEEIASYRAKMEQRIKNMLGDMNIQIEESRILTECAIFADKVAIDEELVRLASHFEAFEEITKSKDPVGRKLDFLLQEINRETNTIGSKVCDSNIARRVVDIKSELEKIREQIQNIE